MQCLPVFIHAQINHQTTNSYKWYSIISLPVLPQNIDMRETRLVRWRVVTAASIMTVFWEIMAWSLVHIVRHFGSTCFLSVFYSADRGSRILQNVDDTYLHTTWHQGTRKVFTKLYIIMKMSELPIKCKSFCSNYLKTLCMLFTAADEDMFSQNSDREGTVSAHRNLQEGNYTVTWTFY